MKKSAGQRTREKILKAASKTWPDVSPTTLAKATGMTHPNILYHFPDNSIVDGLVEYAIEHNLSCIIVWAIAMGHKAVEGLPNAERTRHFQVVHG